MLILLPLASLLSLLELLKAHNHPHLLILSYFIIQYFINPLLNLIVIIIIFKNGFDKLNSQVHYSSDLILINFFQKCQQYFTLYSNYRALGLHFDIKMNFMQNPITEF